MLVYRLFINHSVHSGLCNNKKCVQSAERGICPIVQLYLLRSTLAS